MPSSTNPSSSVNVRMRNVCVASSSSTKSTTDKATSRAPAAGPDDVPLSTDEFLGMVALMWHLKIPTIDATLLSKSTESSSFGLSGHGGQSLVDKVHDNHSFLDELGQQKNVFVVAYKRTLSQPPKDPRLDKARELAAVIREIRVLAHPPLQAHPNIVRLVGNVWEDEDGARMSPVSILEYADRGSLSDLLESEAMPTMRYKCRENICLDISHGLDALHQCKVIWGDCKPGNILIFSTGPSPYNLKAKISDFGLAVVDPGPNDTLPGGTALYKDHVATSGFDGLCASDVYSLGLVIAAVMSNGSHFKDFTEKNQKDQPEDQMKVRVQQAKLAGTLPALFEDTVKKALRPNQDELHSPLASELDLEVVGMAIRLAIESRASLHEVMKTFQCGRTFNKRISANYCPPDDFSDPLSYMRIEYNYNSSAKRLNETIFHLLQIHEKKCSSSGKSNRPSSYPHLLFEIAISYAIGFGTSRNIAFADRFIKLAAEAGSLDAQALIVKFLNIEDKLVHVLDAEHKEWLNAGANAGSWVAARALSRTFHEDISEIRQSLARDRLRPSYIFPKSPGDIEVTLRKKLGRGDININDYDIGRPGGRLDKPLHLAALNGRVDAVKILLGLPGADVDTRNSHGETPLICAMRSGHISVADVLIEKDADVTVADIRGITALHWLISCQDQSMSSIAGKLKRRGAQINSKSMVPLQYSPIYGATLVPGTPLDWAVDTCNSAALRTFVELDADMLCESGGRPPALHRVAQAHMHDLMVQTSFHRKFSDNVIRLDSKGNSPLWYALQPTDAFGRMVRSLRGRNVESTILTELLDKGADWSLVNSFGETAIYAAVKAGATSCVELLLEKKRPDETLPCLLIGSGAQNFLALRRAIYNNDEDIFRLLLGYIQKHDPKWLWQYDRSKDGLTLLHECCFVPEEVSILIVEMLRGFPQKKKKQAMREALKMRGRKEYSLTPFQLAVLCNKPLLADKFREYGADPLSGVHGKRLLGYLIDYQTLEVARVASFLETIYDDAIVRTARRFPHPGRILPSIELLLGEDESWFEASKKMDSDHKETDDVHDPKLIASAELLGYCSFIIGPREDIKQSVQYGSRWVTALDLSLDAVSQTSFPKSAEKVFEAIVKKWRFSRHLNFPDTHYLHNRLRAYKNLRRRETLLHRAIRMGNEQLVRWILEAGADWEMANDEWLSPLHLAKNLAAPGFDANYPLKNYSASFWGRLDPPHARIYGWGGIKYNPQFEPIVDRLAKIETAKESRRQHFMFVRALREIWWPWDDYEMDTFGYKHVLLWLVIALIAVGIFVLMFFVGSTLNKRPPNIMPIVGNITNVLDIMAMDAISAVTTCFDRKYTNGIDSTALHAFCTLAWLNRMNAANERLSVFSDFIIQGERDCYDLAQARNESFDGCRRTRTPRYFLDEFPRAFPTWNVGNMTNDMCTVEFVMPKIVNSSYLE